MQRELDHIAGALETLDLLRERLELQLNEAVDESARDAVDETISFVASLEVEYRRRRKALHPHHETRLFLLGESGIEPLVHDRYLALLRGAAAPAQANRGMRLADWYLRTEQGIPQAVIRESYQWFVFDGQGRLDLHAAHEIVEAPLPSDAERLKIHALIFHPEY